MKRVFGFLGLLGFCGLAMAEPISTAIAAVTSVLGATGTAAAAGVLGSAVAGKLIGGRQSMAVPKPAATPMPSQDDEAVRRARQRQIAEIQSRSGRASTILSDGGSKLGG